jgi:HK97 family phage prohead protease
MTLLYRSANTPVESDGKAFTGYAVRWYDGTPGTEYQLKPGLVERVRRGAFTKTLSDGHDVRALYHHKNEDILGRTSAGTLHLAEDDKGLRFRIPFDADDPDHMRMRAKIKNQSVTGCSFGFRPIKSEYSPGVVELAEVYLGEISLISDPAYTSTSVDLRSDDGTKSLIAAYDMWEESRRIDEIIRNLKA